MSEALLKQILQEITGLREDVANITQEQIKLNDQLLSIKGQPGNEVMDYIKKMNRRIDTLQIDLEFTYQKAAQHDLQINRLEHSLPKNH